MKRVLVDFSSISVRLANKWIETRDLAGPIFIMNFYCETIMRLKRYQSRLNQKSRVCDSRISWILSSPVNSFLWSSKSFLRFSINFLWSSSISLSVGDWFFITSIGAPTTVVMGRRRGIGEIGKVIPVNFLKIFLNVCIAESADGKSKMSFSPNEKTGTIAAPVCIAILMKPFRSLRTMW